MPWLHLALPLIVLLGVSLGFWSVVGMLRRISELLARRFRWRRRGLGPRLYPADVAVLIPARNEALVIAATIRSVLRLVPPTNVHVIADGCDDGTATIARSYGLNVLEVYPAGGKAAGIEAAVHHFDLPGRYAVLLLLDADTELDRQYLRRGLPLFDDQSVVAVAGYARTSWRPAELSRVGRLLVAYRTRLYAVMQWLKYGQTWRWTNLTAIVPGFASMYRTWVLPRIDLNPPGLVIEDFNMTFELHHKRLGRIAFHPGVCATTQDPDNLRDYVRQVTRWQLGLWQTVRRHGLWRSWFCLALAAFLLEVVVASAALLLLAVTLVLAPLARAGHGLLGWGWLAGPDRFLAGWTSLPGIMLFVVLPDFLLTCAAAVAMRRPSLLRYGLGFLPIRMIDATVMLWTLPRAWWARSSGLWTSPGRRTASSPPTLHLPRPRSAPDGRPANGQATNGQAVGPPAVPSPWISHQQRWPAPRAEQAAPRADEPAPRAEQPAPCTEQPAPRVEQPADATPRR
jgi:cellulose synthase/poly-beta-1,6-N-acetylglucosamine synthase-like glycosyltransferase